MNKHSFKSWLLATRPWSFPASGMPILVTLAYLFWLDRFHVDDGCACRRIDMGTHLPLFPRKARRANHFACLVGCCCIYLVSNMIV